MAIDTATVSMVAPVTGERVTADLDRMLHAVGGRFRIPDDDSFDASDKAAFLSGKDIEYEAGKLYSKHALLNGHTNYRIDFLWKRTGGARNGAPTLGACQKPSGLLAFFSGCDFVIWLAADHCKEQGLDDEQMEALLFHELLHIGQDDTGKPILLPHDFEGFRAEIEEYGLHDDRAKMMADAFQMRLFEMGGGPA